MSFNFNCCFGPIILWLIFTAILAWTFDGPPWRR